MTTNENANELAVRTEDAYMAEAYGADWAECAQTLLDAGYDAVQAEAILRSKHMRWAGDDASTDEPTAEDFRSYLAEYRAKYFTAQAVGELVAQTDFYED